MKLSELRMLCFSAIDQCFPSNDAPTYTEFKCDKVLACVVRISTCRHGPKANRLPWCGLMFDAFRKQNLFMSKYELHGTMFSS